MIDWLGLQPNDRVLLLSIPDPFFVDELARKLASGLIVALGPEEKVRSARRAARGLENVLFVPASPDDIPWQDGFFTKAVDFVCSWENPERAAREVARVLSSGGQIYLADPARVRQHLLASGFHLSKTGEFVLSADVR